MIDFRWFPVVVVAKNQITYVRISWQIPQPLRTDHKSTLLEWCTNPLVTSPIWMCVFQSVSFPYAVHNHTHTHARTILFFFFPVGTFYNWEILLRQLHIRLLCSISNNRERLDAHVCSRVLRVFRSLYNQNIYQLCLVINKAL